jgi:hypothetical protein
LASGGNARDVREQAEPEVSDWLMIGGGATMMILGFVLPWSTVSFGGISDSGDGPFDYFLTGGIAWILVVTVGVLALLRAMERLPETQPWPLLFLVAGGLATLLMLLRLLIGGRELIPGLDADRGIGMYLSFVWAAVTAVGAFMSFRESGGDIKDLTDMGKLKNSFSARADGEGAPPPPPPPSAD